MNTYTLMLTVIIGCLFALTGCVGYAPAPYPATYGGYGGSVPGVYIASPAIMPVIAPGPVYLGGFGGYRYHRR